MASPATSFTDEGTAQRRKGASQGPTARWYQSHDGTQESQSPSHHLDLGQPWARKALPACLLVLWRDPWRQATHDQLSSLAPR